MSFVKFKLKQDTMAQLLKGGNSKHKNSKRWQYYGETRVLID